MSNYTVLNNKVREYKNFISEAEAAGLVAYLEQNDGGRGNINLLKLDTLPAMVESVKARVMVEIKDISGDQDEALENKVLKLWKHPHGASTRPKSYGNFAFMLYLNDQYEGGEFIMPSQNISIKPDALSLFVFETGDEYGVDAVDAGTKYSMGGAFEWPNTTGPDGAR